jgi:hypothetical protein
MNTTFILNSHGYSFEISNSWCHRCNEMSLRMAEVNKAGTKMLMRCKNDPSHTEVRTVYSIKRFTGADAGREQ